MNRLVRAELAKLRSTRLLQILVAVAAVTVAGIITGQIINAGKVGAPSLGTTTSLRALLSAVGVTAPLALVVGAVTVTSEFRHDTIPVSLLAVPDRRRLLVAKAVTLAALGAAVAIGGIVLDLAIVLPYLLAAGVPVDLVNGDLLLTISGVLAGIPLYAVAGVGIGALVRRQTVAVVAPLIWLGVVETVLPSYGLAAAARWLPGGATGALGRAEVAGLLPMWAGGLLLAGYAAAFVALGLRRFARMDV